MDVGATSLATPEANVRAKVQAARNVLAALRGDPGPWDLRGIDDDLDDILTRMTMAQQRKSRTLLRRIRSWDDQ